MKKLFVVAALLLAATVSVTPAEARTCELWGQKVRVLGKTSARNGYDAVTVKGRGGTFMVLTRRNKRWCR